MTVGVKTKVITISYKLTMSVRGRARPYYHRLRGEPRRHSKWGNCMCGNARRGLPHTIGGKSALHTITVRGTGELAHTEPVAYECAVAGQCCGLASLR